MASLKSILSGMFEMLCSLLCYLPLLLLICVKDVIGPCIRSVLLSIHAASARLNRRLRSTPSLQRLMQKSTLCYECRCIDLPGLRRGLQHHASYGALRSCAKSCPLCELFLRVMSDGGPTSLFGILKINTDPEIGEVDKAIFVVGDKAGQLDISCRPDDPAAKLILTRPLQPLTNSLEVFQLANKWIKDCHANHRDCTSLTTVSTNGAKLPKRVVDVGSKDGSQQPHLFETAGQNGRWVALTYCWGHIPFLQTTSENIEALRQEITMSSLPQTFQDAITITRQLGIKYLWIDALCIQQDSDSDWQTESANMPAIYANAYVTLAASSAENSHSGILNPRSWVSTRVDSCNVKLDKRSIINFRTPINHDDEMDFLSRRAWCFQEKVLSPRLLSFYPTQITYTCSRNELTEGNYVRDVREKKKIFPPHQYWFDFLTDYTQRTLTFPRDKLIAISGVADYIQREISDEYLAGLWKESLPQALLWQNPPSMPCKLSNGRLNFREKVKTYRAPSWSWASVEGPVDFGDCISLQTHQVPTRRLSSQCTIVQCAVKLSSVDPYGQVSGGYIKIKGSLKRAICKPSYGTALYYNYRVAVLLNPDEEDSGNPQDCTGIFDVQEFPEGREVWCLQITIAFGLILVPNIAGEGAFRRVGKCCLRCIGPERYSDWFRGSEKQTVTIV